MKRTTGLLLFVWLIGHSQGLQAYEPGTHREMARRAAEASSIDQVLKSELALRGGVAEKLLELEVREFIGDGAFFEDEPVFRVLNHFHNPLRPWGEAGLRLPLLGQIGQSSILWQQNPAQDSRSGGGNASWQDARQRYLAALTGATKAERERAFGDTFRVLGQLTHLVQDASVPAHVRNDSHLIYEGYEKWVERTRTSSQARSVFERLLNGEAVRPSLLIFSPTDVAQAPVPIARLIDTDTFLGENSEVLRLTSIGIAEYTNGNFLSDDTIFWDFALPRRAGLGGDFFEPEGQRLRRYFEKVGDGEAIRHFVAESALYEAVNAELGRPMDEAVILTRLAYQDYAEKILPRAVGYSAALLDYFFRGRLDVDLVGASEDPSLLWLAGTNASPDTLVDGTLTLYADDPAGVRRPVPALAPTFVRDVAPGQEVSTGTFQAPEDAERFVAVYQGTLGLEAKDPDRSFPGGAIGKVLGGVRVEEVFSDGTRWKIRTPRGVFLLPLTAAEFEEVRWGDGDSILVARTPLGPNEANRVVAYDVERQPNSVELVTVDTPEGPEVRLTQKNEAVFPFGMSLDTTVQFSQTIQYRQQRLTYEFTRVFRWVAPDPTEPNAGNYSELASYEYGPLQVEMVVDEAVPFSENFPVALDLAHNGDFGTAWEPYIWYLQEVAADASGRLLGVVVVYLISPETPGVIRSVFGPPDSPFPVIGQTLVAPYFPLEVNPLLWAIVDLKERRVVASTAEPTITISSERTQEVPNWLSPRSTGTFVWEHLFDSREGGPRPGQEAPQWFGQPIELRPEGRPVRELNELHVRQDGVRSLSVSGWLREELKDELARRGLYRFELGSGQASREYVYDSAGLRVIGSASGVRESPVQFSEARRSRPAPGGERLVFMAEGEGALRGTRTVLVWDPGTRSAKVLHQFRGGAQWLGPATRASVMVPSLSFRPFEFSGFLIPLEGAQEPTVFQGQDFRETFTLLDPHYLYNVEDMKFYRSEPPLQRTALPATLADLPGNPVGDYHAIRLP